MATKKKEPKDVLVCGCIDVKQKKDRFIKNSTGLVCECTVRDRKTGMFRKTSTGLKQVTFGSISMTKSSDVAERVK